MIKELQLQKLWFVAKNDEMEKELDTDDAIMGVSIFANINESKGYFSITDIPTEILENVILFQAYQFTFNNQPVTIQKNTEIENFHHVFFISKEEAESFKEEIIDDMQYDYWDDDEERSALISLGYDLNDDEDFSEISINEDRRWNDYLGRWYLRSFEGLGYKIHYNGEVIEF